MPEPSGDTPALVDARSDAYLCFVLQDVTDAPDVERTTWATLRETLEPRLAAFLSDPSAARTVASNLRALLVDSPGVPIGVTWDGGFAITFSDYRAAERRLRAARPTGASDPSRR